MTIRLALVSLTAACMVAACGSEKPPPRTPPAPATGGVQAVFAVLDDFHAAAAQADEQRYFSHLSEDSVFLGTDASERWDKRAFRAYARPHFARGKAWSFRSVRRNVTIAPGGRFAWFDEDLATPNLGPARGSGVLAFSDGRWRITQYNLALTIPNERFALVKEAAGGALLAPADASGPISNLAWLSGAWLAEKPSGDRVEEIWSSASGGTLIGSGRTIRAGKTTFFEHLRIEARAGGVVYVAQPLGRPPTEFAAVEVSDSRLVFENRAHDWPKRLSYRRVAEGVSVRVEGDTGQPVEEWTMRPALVVRSAP